MLYTATCINFQMRKPRHREATLPVNSKAEIQTGSTSFDGSGDGAGGVGHMSNAQY